MVANITPRPRKHLLWSLEVRREVHESSLELTRDHSAFTSPTSSLCGARAWVASRPAALHAAGAALRAAPYATAILRTGLLALGTRLPPTPPNSTRQAMAGLIRAVDGASRLATSKKRRSTTGSRVAAW